MKIKKLICALAACALLAFSAACGLSADTKSGSDNDGSDAAVQPSAGDGWQSFGSAPSADQPPALPEDGTQLPDGQMPPEGFDRTPPDGMTNGQGMTPPEGGQASGGFWGTPPNGGAFPGGADAGVEYTAALPYSGQLMIFEAPSAPLSAGAENEGTVITLSPDKVSIEGDGASAQSGVVTISRAGEYTIRGTLGDGRIVVDTDDDEKVTLVFDGVMVTSADGPAVYIMSAPEKVVIRLAQGSVNILADGTAYAFDANDSDAPSACVFSMEDIQIEGGGTLYVNGNYNKGIFSKDDLEIKGGRLYITAVDDGIRGKDSLSVTGGDVSISCAGDGLRTSNEEKGELNITGGSISITALQDGVQAETALVISGGVLSIGAAEDGINCVNGTISGGEISIACGDDAIHGDLSLAVTAGSISISTCNEGLESEDIVISGGVISLAAIDDGINASLEDDASGNVPRIVISGGEITVAAAGDGIDSNGDITMSGGSMTVFGPAARDNAAIDYDGRFVISGGTLFAVGSAGMAQAPTGSGQGVVSVNVGVLEAGRTLSVTGPDGQTLIEVLLPANYGHIVFSCPGLSAGDSCSIAVDGAALLSAQAK